MLHKDASTLDMAGRIIIALFFLWVADHQSVEGADQGSR